MGIKYMTGTHDNKITRMSNNMGENKNRIMWASFKQIFPRKIIHNNIQINSPREYCTFAKVTVHSSKYLAI